MSHRNSVNAVSALHFFLSSTSREPWFTHRISLPPQRTFLCISFPFLHKSKPNLNQPFSGFPCVFLCAFPHPVASSPLKDHDGIAELEEENGGAVKELYAALHTGDVETVQRLLASDLEWWFHGPPSSQHLMRVLTGASSDRQFCFNPQTITAISDRVFAEGQDENGSVYWVHVWTVNDGIITQIREYFNTSLVVREFHPPSPPPPPSSSSSSLLHSQRQVCLTIWQSEPLKSNGKSMPGLVLAI